jgi:hypothetical protein
MVPASLQRWRATLRVPSLCFALMTVAGCATTTAVDENTVRADWGDCIMRAVARLDDGKSDPASVAFGIAPQCSVLYARLTEIMVGKNITDQGQAAMRAQMRAGEVQLITSAILTYRAAHPRAS